METEPPIRLALVITELYVGGAERCLVNLATGLDRRRFSPEVYSLWPRPPADQGELVRQLEAASIPVHFVDARSPWQLPGAKSRLREMLTAQDPDVVQAFLFHANVLGGWAARKLDRAQLVLGLRVADPSRWRQVAERVIARRARRVVCVSESVARFAKTDVGIPDGKLVVIPNGIKIDDYQSTQAILPTELGIDSGREWLLCVARLHRQKGIDRLLFDAKEFLARLPTHDLVIAGHGPEQNALQDVAEELGIRDRVHFVGWRNDVARLLRRSSLLVLPSRWEGMPNAVLEAMAAGIPVVANDVEGVTELLGEHASVQVVDPRDPRAFSDRVVEILSQPELRQALGQANLRRANGEFSLKSAIRRYADLYTALVRSGYE